MGLRSACRKIGHAIGEILAPRYRPTPQQREADRKAAEESRLARDLERVDRYIRTTAAEITQIDGAIADKTAKIRNIDVTLLDMAHQKDVAHAQELKAVRHGKISLVGSGLGLALGTVGLVVSVASASAPLGISMLAAGLTTATAGGSAYMLFRLKADDASLKQQSLGYRMQWQGRDRQYAQDSIRRAQTKRLPLQRDLETWERERLGLVMKKKEREVASMARAVNAPPPPPKKVDVTADHISIGGVRIQRNTAARP